MEMSKDWINVISNMLKEQEERKQQIVQNATEWYLLTCPHCNTTFRVTPNGCGTHCYDYLTDKCESIVVSIATGTAECPVCKYEFSDKGLKEMIWAK